jgi:hypothetical protein
MSKREEYLAWCSRQVGTSENPAGSNNVPYNTEYYGHPVNDPSAHWCAVAVWAGLKAVGCSDLYYGGRKTASCPNLLEYYRKNHPEQIVTDPQPGDWVFFDWDASGIPDHIGTVEAVGKGEITTLEGNVGDAYKRLIRKRDWKILAYVRPAWPDDEPLPDPGFPFVDVKKDRWSYKAIKLDYEHGIVSGTDSTHFSPTNTCTREQVTQMIYKAVKPLYDKLDALEKGGG